MPKTRLDFLIESTDSKIRKYTQELDDKTKDYGMLIVTNEISFLRGAISAYEDILKDLKQLKEVEHNED